DVLGSWERAGLKRATLAHGGKRLLIVGRQQVEVLEAENARAISTLPIAEDGGVREPLENRRRVLFSERRTDLVVVDLEDGTVAWRFANAADVHRGERCITAISETTSSVFDLATG